MSLATETIKAPKTARLEKSARTLLAKAEASLGADRQTNTRKRAEEAQHARRRALKEIQCVEVNYTLAALLEAKGFDVVRADFLTWLEENRGGAHEWGGPFNVVLANFPFEDGADAIHAMAAFKRVCAGGVMVFITGEGIWFRGDRVSQQFRGWIDSLGDAVIHNEKLPAGTFNVSDVTQRTGVASRLLAVRRAAA